MRVIFSLLSLCFFALSFSVSVSAFAADLRPASEISHPQAFLNWQARFKARAMANGISPQIIDRAFRGIGYNSRVVRLDRNQAEFKKSFSDYLGVAIVPSRLQPGLVAARQHARLLSRIEANYGVDRAVILGIWGMETRFGKKLGDIPIAEALGTLAVEGRRRGFAEEQLMAALRLAQQGNVAPETMIGSWAGALGHTQFIPTSYAAYAVDGNGDGRRNLWQIADALASTANYLKRSGWQKGQPWGVEVILPNGFNRKIGEGNWQGVDYWNGQGVRTANGAAIPNFGAAAILAPGGANGPKFAVFNNFKVIKRYNNSTFYAISVGHLGDLAVGKAPLRHGLARQGDLLMPAEVEELQKLLTAKGFVVRKIDGVMGDETRGVIMAYQKRHGLAVDGVADRELMKHVRGW